MAVAAVQVPDTLVTTYLHMTDVSQFQPAWADDHRGSVNIVRMSAPDVNFYRFLYSSVGEMWRWRDRLLLSDDELIAVLEDPNTSVYVLYADGIPAGYVELSRQGSDTEIAYFGLRPNYMGRSLGKHLLSYGIARAWEDGARRVFVHTCNLDSPFALTNYMKRGFQVYRVDEQPMPMRYA